MDGFPYFLQYPWITISTINLVEAHWDMDGFTYTLQLVVKDTVSAINRVETHGDMDGFTYFLQ
jgi:hypothetical protein